ncbi:MAG: LysM peptidoglycan-binding domain-containing protein [Elusimicrobia bacterium]|nr:LysM peptidoglycan-binding domain-containing protein [Candidatus Liberimonas magnetica]
MLSIIKFAKIYLTPFFLLVIFCSIIYAEVLQEITVKEGDTLWGVANYYLKDPKRWPEILKYNKLPSSDPNLILPGMKLNVPILLIKENLRTASLIEVVNDVRYRRQKDAEWNPAWKDMKLYNEDGLRTLQQSIAQVKFPSGEILKLDENSLVILRPEKVREEASLLSGGLRSSRTKILTASTIVDPHIDARGIPPDFKTKIKEDMTTIVEVFEGIVDVTSQGRTVTLTKGFGTEVKVKEPPSLPHALPPEPKTDISINMSKTGPSATPSHPVKKVVSSSLDVSVIPPPDTNVSRSSKAEYGAPVVANKNVTRYHLQISSGSDFHSVLIDKIHSFSEKVNIRFADYDLPDGIYYYRYAYIDNLDFEGRYTLPIEFGIDNVSPVLEIYPEKKADTADKFIHIEGKTEPGALLKVNDNPVPVDENGRFISAILPKRAYDVITVTAQDYAGNITTEEVVVKGHKITQKQVKEKPIETIRKKGSSFFSASLAVLTIIVILGVLVIIVK